MKAKVFVKFKPSVLDPQGQAILHSLHAMGLSGFTDVRQGKFFEIEINSNSKEEALELLNTASQKLLANTVIESFEVVLP